MHDTMGLSPRGLWLAPWPAIGNMRKASARPGRSCFCYEKSSSGAEIAESKATRRELTRYEGGESGQAAAVGLEAPGGIRLHSVPV